MFGHRRSVVTFFFSFSIGLTVWLAPPGDRLNAAPPKLPLATPESRGLLPGLEKRVQVAVEAEIEKGNLPGCVVAVGYQGHLVLLHAYGDRQIEPSQEPMTTDTVFDLASLTKPVATATSIMVLLQEGKIRLNAPVADYIPEFAASGKQSITVQQLLVHQGGLIPDNSLRDYQDGPDEAMNRIYALKTVIEPGTKFKYTDVGFIVLADIVKRVSGENVHAFSQKHIFQPLGMTATGYLPGPELRARCAPHDKREDQWIKGEVHDPRSHRLGGIAGHAGLFSTATDLAVYAQMMLNGGRYYGARPLGTRTIKTMTAPYPVSSGVRGLGWDKQTGYSSNKGELLSNRAFGHGGFTGTAMWMDPEIEMFIIFLSNRLHPDGKGSVNRLAGRIATLAASSINVPLNAGTDDLQTGIDLLRAEEYASLRGQRVGLIANQTASNYCTNLRMLISWHCLVRNTELSENSIKRLLATVKRPKQDSRYSASMARPELQRRSSCRKLTLWCLIFKTSALDSIRMSRQWVWRWKHVVDITNDLWCSIGRIQSTECKLLDQYWILERSRLLDFIRFPFVTV